jgi:predicted O-methyltransferase YrrM
MSSPTQSEGTTTRPGEAPVAAAAELLDAIYRDRQVIDRDGKRHPLHSEVTQDEGQLMASLIERHRFTRTLEIGCAFGISSLFICEALRRNGAGRHTIIDPGQHTYWQGIGVGHLARCGLSNYELIERPSEFALPELAERDRSFQFALIDGFHTFDQVLLDFFFIDRMLEVGGIVVLDDLQLPGIRKVARYIAKYPNYSVVAHAKRSVFPGSWKRRLVERFFRLLSSLLPRHVAACMFDDSFFVPDAALGLVAEMVAFEKTAPDDRGSHWYQPF